MSEDKAEIRQKTINRRNFLIGLGEVAIIGAATAEFGAISGAILNSDNPRSTPKTPHATSESYLDPETQKKQIELISLDNINKYRKMFGLRGITLDDVANVGTEHTWEDKPEAFINTLDQTSKSYGMEADRILKSVYGENRSRLVYGIQGYRNSPDAVQFDSVSRMIIIPTRYHLEEIDGVKETLCHEGLGHGFDPFLTHGIYPQDMIFKLIEHRMAMVSRMTSVPGEFLNHPNDAMLPFIQVELGKNIVMNYRDGKLDENMETVGINLFKIIIDDIAKNKNIPPSLVKFNKKVCTEVGKELVSHMIHGEIVLKGDLYKHYSDYMETVMVEMFAEMVRNGIMHPENVDGFILSHLESFLSVINKRHQNLSDIREQVQQSNPEIAQRFEEEKVLRRSSESPSPVSEPKTMTKEELDQAKKQDEDNQRREETFHNLIKTGKIPRIPNATEQEESSTKAFGMYYSAILNKYPKLEMSQDFYSEFDPNLDIWDIDSIQEALNSVFIRQFLEHIENGDKLDVQDLKKRTYVLHDFLYSPAFGT